MSNRLIVLLLLCSYSVFGQENPFLFPIKPGKLNAISGSVGELRNTHFHTGLDIKTEGVIGLPVYASQDGYISRISVRPGGYGHALYIKHTNGYTTVYAHLNRFIEPIADYVLKEQYKNKTFALNRYPKKGVFPVKKGDIIAYSGNSGSSAGPHLHWDVRDAYQRPVNSLADYFEEIRDSKPPIINRIAFRTMDLNSTINGEFGRFEFPIYKLGLNYRLFAKVNLKGNIAIELLAHDRLDDSNNRCGITEFEIIKDGSLQFKSKIELLSFSKQTSIYVFYNYATRIGQGDKFTKLYTEDGNDLPFYDNSPGNGVLSFNEGDSSEILIRIGDSYKNISTLLFVNSPESSIKNNKIKKDGFSIDGNIMSYVSQDSLKDAGLLYNGKPDIIQAKKENGKVILADLRKGIPGKLIIDGEELEVPYQQVINPGKDYKYFGEKIDIQFSKISLFDTLYLSTSYQYEDSIEIFSLNHSEIPLKRPITVTLKPAEHYNEKKASVYALDDNGNLYYQAGTWENGKISFRTQYFGAFTIASDTIAPKITPRRLNSSRVSFRIYDRGSGIKKYDLKIDNKWVLLHYDPKNQRVWSERLNKETTLAGNLLLSVTDQSGNTSIFKSKIE